MLKENGTGVLGNGEGSFSDRHDAKGSGHIKVILQLCVAVFMSFVLSSCSAGVQSGDTTAPIISGAGNITITQGEAVSYLSGVSAEDETDGSVDVTVSTEDVDLNTPGVYNVTYSATDSAGNVSTVTILLTVVAASEVQSEPEDERLAELNELAAPIYNSIITDDMTDMEKASAIYDWCQANISYDGYHDETDWISGAEHAFKTHGGDCFNYFAAAKELLTLAGINNMDVVKSDTSKSSHYWSLVNINGSWYHFDCTPRRGGGDYFFLVTDDQLEEYSQAHGNSHIFDHSLYPATSTVVITDMNAKDDGGDDSYGAGDDDTDSSSESSSSQSSSGSSRNYDSDDEYDDDDDDDYSTSTSGGSSRSSYNYDDDDDYDNDYSTSTRR